MFVQATINRCSQEFGTWQMTIHLQSNGCFCTARGQLGQTQTSSIVFFWNWGLSCFLRDQSYYIYVYIYVNICILYIVYVNICILYIVIDHIYIYTYILYMYIFQTRHRLSTWGWWSWSPIRPEGAQWRILGCISGWW